MSIDAAPTPAGSTVAPTLLVLKRTREKSLPALRPASLRQVTGDWYALTTFCCWLALVIMPLELGIVSRVCISLRWVVLGILAIAGIGQWLKCPSPRMSLLHWSLIAFMVVGAFSCAFSIDPWYSVQRLLSFVMLWVAIFLGCWCWMQRRNNVLVAAELLCGIIIFVSVVALFRVDASQILDRSERATGAFGKATGAGSFAAFSIPLILWKLRYSRGYVRRVAQFVLVLQSYLLFFSGARGALLSMAISLPVFLWFTYPKARPAALLAVCGLAFFLGTETGLNMLPEYVVRRDTIATGTGRFERATGLLKTWMKRPLTGYGYGVGRFMIVADSDALNAYLGDERDTNAAKRLLRAHRAGIRVEIQPHNDHVERLVECGIGGYACFLAMMMSLGKAAMTSLKMPRHILGDLARALAASVGFVAVNTMLHSGLFAVGSGIIVMAWVYCVLLVKIEQLG